MKSLKEYLAYYDPMRESNERYLPEDYATLRYSRATVIADEKVIGASLYPHHVQEMSGLSVMSIVGRETVGDWSAVNLRCSVWGRWI